MPESHLHNQPGSGRSASGISKIQKGYILLNNQVAEYTPSPYK